MTAATEYPKWLVEKAKRCGVTPGHLHDSYGLFWDTFEHTVYGLHGDQVERAVKRQAMAHELDLTEEECSEAWIKSMEDFCDIALAGFKEHRERIERERRGY